MAKERHDIAGSLRMNHTISSAACDSVSVWGHAQSGAHANHSGINPFSSVRWYARATSMNVDGL